MSIFYFIFIAYFLINAFIAWWFFHALKGAGWLRWVVPFIVAGLTLLYPYMFRESGHSMAHVALMKLGAIWAGTFFYTFVLILLIGLGRMLIPSWRNRELSPRYVSATLVIVLSAVITTAGWYNAAHPVIKEVEITIPVSETAPELKGRTLKVAFLSDIHLGRLVSSERFERMIDLIVPQNPDLVVFPGDVLDDHLLLDIPELHRILGKLNPPLGIWGALGNHEYHSGPVEKSLGFLDRMGIRMLVDDWAELGDAMLLVGRNDYSARRLAGNKRSELKDILNRIPMEKRHLPVLLLDHQPQHLEQAEQAGVALQLSGHTHNGQLWPFNYITDALYENARGYSRRGNTQYLVSSGAGTWGPPIRTNSRAEVVIILIRFN